MEALKSASKSFGHLHLQGPITGSPCWFTFGLRRMHDFPLKQVWYNSSSGVWLKLEIIIEELNASREQIQEFEMSQASLFDQTAENRARNKTILWWVLNLAYEKNGDDYKKIFDGEDHDARLASYDRYEEQEDDFIDEMLKKFSYVVSFWFITKAETQEELDVLLKTSEDEDEEEEAEEPSEVEKAAGEEDQSIEEIEENLDELSKEEEEEDSK